jgi:tRNA threonylcarbamoyladenosine modification (KEOPS) complex Cgi121 subunit
MPYSYPISGSKLWATITAAENIKINNINETLNKLDQIVEDKIYQLFDAEKITDQNHLYYSAANAYYAMENRTNISNKLDIEILLYTSTQSQISKAIKLIGVSSSTQLIAIIVLSGNEDDPTAVKIAHHLGDLNDKVLELNPEKYEALKQLYGITEIAIQTTGYEKYKALTSLITEKSALLSLRR